MHTGITVRNIGLSDRKVTYGTWARDYLVGLTGTKVHSCTLQGKHHILVPARISSRYFSNTPPCRACIDRRREYLQYVQHVLYLGTGPGRWWHACMCVLRYCMLQINILLLLSGAESNKQP